MHVTITSSLPSPSRSATDGVEVMQPGSATGQPGASGNALRDPSRARIGRRLCGIVGSGVDALGLRGEFAASEFAGCEGRDAITRITIATITTAAMLPITVGMLSDDPDDAAA